MHSPEANDVKARILACPACEHQMTNVASAMRHHESEMVRALQLAKKPDLIEEDRLKAKARVTESFVEAQAAWDAYRDHLIEHGFLPPR